MEADMTRHEMQAFVQDQINKGLERTEAIRNLAFHLDEDDPGDFAEIWFQQKISGE
jgi:hypothetical protein